MFSSLKIAIVLTLLALGGTGFMWIKNLQRDLEIARENVAKMEVAVQISEASIKTMQADIVRQAELNKTLQADLQKAEQYGDELRATLQKHNLTALAQRKPGLIEDRMQDATNKLWNDLRGITDPNGVLDVQSGTANSNSN
jgi:hypothetical protein